MCEKVNHDRRWLHPLPHSKWASEAAASPRSSHKLCWCNCFSLLAVLGSRLCQGCSEIQSGLLNAEIRNKTCIALVELNLQELCCSSGGDWMTLIFHPTQGSYQQITPIMSQGFLKTERKRGIIEPENLWKDSWRRVRAWWLQFCCLAVPR